MSRYSVPAINKEHNVIVGFDPPLESFFIQVFQRTTRVPDDAGESDDCEQPVFWMGADYEEIPTIESLKTAAEKFASLDANIVEQLVQDQKNNPPLNTPVRIGARKLIREWSDRKGGK